MLEYIAEWNYNRWELTMLIIQEYKISLWLNCGLTHFQFIWDKVFVYIFEETLEIIWTTRVSCRIMGSNLPEPFSMLSDGREGIWVQKFLYSIIWLSRIKFENMCSLNCMPAYLPVMDLHSAINTLEIHLQHTCNTFTRHLRYTCNPLATHLRYTCKN